MTLTILSFEPGDLARIDRIDEGPSLSDIASRAEVVAEQGAYTAWEEGEIIACFGVVKWWDGLGEAYLIASPHLVRHRFALVRRFDKFIHDEMDRLDLRRVQASVARENRLAVRMANVLFGEPEAMLRAFDNSGRDCYIFSRIR